MVVFTIFSTILHSQAYRKKLVKRKHYAILYYYTAMIWQDFSNHVISKNRKIHQNCHCAACYSALLFLVGPACLFTVSTLCLELYVLSNWCTNIGTCDKWAPQDTSICNGEVILKIYLLLKIYRLHGASFITDSFTFCSWAFKKANF